MIVGSIVDEMEKDNLFEKEMKEHYVYALTTMIEKWITTIFILAMGVLAKQIVPMILFLIFSFLLESGQVVIMRIPMDNVSAERWEFV